VDDFLIQFGYLGLFAGSFLAASLVPFSSEVLAVGLALLGYDKLLITLVAGTGNFLGALFNYYIGYKGADLFKKRMEADKKSSEKAQKALEKWGAPILFFSWVPFVGDPMTVVAGYFKINLWVFSLWVYPGKLSRYIVILYFL
jgi:membrane protein YqaA with SNARE-associated domain